MNGWSYAAVCALCGVGLVIGVSIAATSTSHVVRQEQAQQKACEERGGFFLPRTSLCASKSILIDTSVPLIAK